MQRKTINKCLRELYGLEIVSATRIHMPDILNTVYRISTNTKTFFLKIYCPAQASNVDNLNKTLKLQSDLSEKNLSPHVLANRNKSYVSIYRSYVFSVQEYMEGEKTSLSDRNIFAKALAELHNVFKEMNYVDSVQNFYKSYEQIKRENEIMLAQNDDPFSQSLIDLKLKILSIIKKDYNPNVIAQIHGDCRPSNSMIDRGNVVFIDFDYSEIGDMMYEIGNSLLLFSQYNYAVFSELLGLYNAECHTSYSVEDVLRGTMMCVLKSSFPVRDKGKMKATTYKKIINEKINVLQFCSFTLMGVEL